MAVMRMPVMVCFEVVCRVFFIYIHDVARDDARSGVKNGDHHMLIRDLLEYLHAVSRT